MKFLILPALAILLFASVSFAAINTAVYLPTDDTYSSYPQDDFSTCGAAGNYSLVHGAETVMYPLCNSGNRPAWHIMIRYNLSSAIEHIIMEGNFSIYRQNSQCPNRQIALFSSFNNSWNESQAVQTLSYYGSVFAPFDTGSGAGYTSQALNVFDPTAMLALYNASTSDGLVSFQSTNDDVACGGSGDKIFLGTKEGGQNATMNFTTADYFTSFLNVTWGGWGSDRTYFDFDSGTASASARAADDILLTRPNATLVQANAAFPNSGSRIALYRTDTSDVQDLADVNCNDPTLVWQNSVMSNLNTNPFGSFWIICVNLTSQHSGRNFMGAVKIIDDKNAYTSFYFAEYSPHYVTFTIPTFFPSHPNNGQNVTVSYTTSLPISDGINVRSTIDGVIEPTIVIRNDTASSTGHTIIIPNITAGVFQGEYCVEPFGYDSIGNSYTGNQSCFNVTALDPATLSKQQVFANYTNMLIVFPVDKISNEPLTATCNILAPPCNLPRCGAEDRLCITNTTINSTNVVICQHGISSCNLSSQPSFNCSVNQAGTTLTTNHDKMIYINGEIATTQYIAIEISTVYQQYPYFYNFTCNALNADFGRRYETISVPIAASPPYPNFYDIDMVISTDQCISQAFGFRYADACASTMGNMSVGAWYCSFDPNSCLETLANTGECLTYGTWTGYSCLNCASIPSGFTCNASAGTGQTANGSSGGATKAGTDWLSRIFGITTEASRAMVAMIISIVVAAIIAWKTRDGLVTVTILLAMLFMFLAIGWLPIWILIMLAVLTAFLIGNFFKKISTASG